MPVMLRELLDLPTAPYLEGHVADYVSAVIGKLGGVDLKRDRYGNLLAHYRRGSRKTSPMCFVAHMDHPGFAALEMVGKGALRAAFRGGVRPEYFAGSKVRFYVAGRWVRGRVQKLTKVDPPGRPGGPKQPREARIAVDREVPAGALGMWDLPPATLRKDRVVARACDDLAGVGALLELLTRLARQRTNGEVYVLFTRAEEVGFVGASGAIAARTVRKRVPVVSIETSSALVNAPIGAGPIIRVGDRAVTYTSRLDAFCTRVANRLVQEKRGFKYQRKLMDGGMCEAAAFGAHGYATIGICLALGNYHNMNTRNGKIASEQVSYADWCAMVELFVALVADKGGPDAKDDSLRGRIDKLFRGNESLLR